MSDTAIQESTPAGVPAPPPDDENEALIDAFTTFKITAISAVVFCAAAFAIIMATRLAS